MFLTKINLFPTCQAYGNNYRQLENVTIQTSNQNQVVQRMISTKNTELATIKMHGLQFIREFGEQL